MNNYRGISVLPPAVKIFEKLLAEKIRDYFDTNSLFMKVNMGFVLFIHARLPYMSLFHCV